MIRTLIRPRCIGLALLALAVAFLYVVIVLAFADGGRNIALGGAGYQTEAALVTMLPACLIPGLSIAIGTYGFFESGRKPAVAALLAGLSCLVMEFIALYIIGSASVVP